MSNLKKKHVISAIFPSLVPYQSLVFIFLYSNTLITFFLANIWGFCKNKLGYECGSIQRVIKLQHASEELLF